ncbi:MAG: SdiA-regulated domain-containing protein [Gammaproteobacteria bacterium]
MQFHQVNGHWVVTTRSAAILLPDRFCRWISGLVVPERLPELGMGLLILLVWLFGCLWMAQGVPATGHAARLATAEFEPLQLNRFEMVGEAVTLPGITDNASGLAINAETNNLLVVNNNPTQILEYSPAGELVRTISLDGFHDTEALVHLYGDQYAVAEERRGNIMQITLNDGTRQIDHEQSRLLAMVDTVGTNHGLEGLAYCHQSKRLFMVIEDQPARLVEVPLGDDLQGPATIISNRFVNHPPRPPGNLDDLSGLHFAGTHGNLLVLSDESKALIELNGEGEIVSRLSLGWRQLGWGNAVPQAEGVTLGADGTLYISSEPNLLYRFRNPSYGPAAQPSLLVLAAR